MQPPACACARSSANPFKGLPRKSLEDALEAALEAAVGMGGSPFVSTHEPLLGVRRDSGSARQQQVAPRNFMTPGACWWGWGGGVKSVMPVCNLHGPPPHRSELDARAAPVLEKRPLDTRRVYRPCCRHAWSLPGSTASPRLIEQAATPSRSMMR